MLTRYCLLDLETATAPDCERWLPPIEPDKRFTDPAKVEADLATKRAAQITMAALDPDLNQIVAFGWQTEEMTRPSATVCVSESGERVMLEMIWQTVTLTRPMVGYGLTWFDAGVLVRRSQLLGVLVPSWVYRQGKYRHDAIIELADRLTLNGMIEQKKGRTLEYHCKRFGIHVDDPVTGKDIASLWEAGDLQAITSHVTGDIDRIRQLAERLCVIPVGGSSARLLPEEHGQPTEAVF